MGKRKEVYAGKGKDGEGKDLTNGQKKLKYLQARTKGGTGYEKPEILTRQDRKRIKKERREAKPHHELVSKANEVWNPKTKNMGKEEKEGKIGEILEGLAGKFKLVSSKHDCSRALQYIIKHGNKDQKLQVFKELKSLMAELVVNTHGHHLVLCMLRYCKPAQKSEVIQVLCGKQLIKLAFHADAAQIIDYLYASCKKKEQDQIMMSFYGPEFALFEAAEKDSMSFDLVLESYPDKRDTLMGYVSKHIAKAMSKEMMHFRHIHGLCARFMKAIESDTEKKLEFISSLAKHALALQHSQEGAWIVCECLAYGNPKTRKTILKALKGHIAEMAVHDYAHMVVVRALDVVDDTVLLNAVVLQELATSDDLLDIMKHLLGRRVIVSLVEPKNKSYFNKNDLELLYPAEIDGNPTSRKPVLSRKAELQAYALPWLLDAAIKHTADLANHKQGTQILYEILKAGHYACSDIFTKEGEDGESVDTKVVDKLKKLTVKCDETFQALADLACSGPLTTDEQPANKKQKQNNGKTQPKKHQAALLGLVDSLEGHFLLKRLLLQCKPSAATFATKIHDTLSEDENLKKALTSNRGAFVVSALLDTQFKDAEYFEPLLTELTTTHLEEIKGYDNAGSTALLSKIQGDAPVKKSKTAKNTPAKTTTTTKIKTKTPSKTPKKKTTDTPSNTKTPAKSAKKTPSKKKDTPATGKGKKRSAE